jgi:hypothetical protein
MIESGLRFPLEEYPAMLWRGALALTAEPPAIFYHDTPIGLSPAETALMALLVRRGRAAHHDIAEALVQAGANIASLDVITYRIRRKFAGVGAGDPIKTHRGWGLTLRVEPDIRGSTALWIGSGAASDTLGTWQRRSAPSGSQAQRRF